MRKISLLCCLAALLLCALCLSSCQAQEKSFSLCQNGHDLVGVELVPATCTEDGCAAYFICNRCYTLFDESGAKTSHERLLLPASHTPDGVWLFDEAEHFQTCLACGEATLSEKHSFENDVCKVCGALKEDPICQHESGKATCLEKAVCEKCGKSYGRLAAHSKVYVANDDFLESEATCTKKASYHASCSLCGFVYAETFTDGEPLGHTGKATCLERAVCTRCGTTFGSLGEHDFSLEDPSPKAFCSPANCSSGATYYKTCSVCGKLSKEATFVSGPANGEEHRFSVLYDKTDDLTHTLVCDLCGEEITAEHTTKTTSCLYPVACDVCEVRFVPNTHVFSLKLTTDDRLALPATCRNPATYFYSCAICERPGTETFSYGEKSNHRYINGACIWCGEMEE